MPVIPAPWQPKNIPALVVCFFFIQSAQGKVSATEYLQRRSTSSMDEHLLACILSPSCSSEKLKNSDYVKNSEQLNSDDLSRLYQPKEDKMARKQEIVKHASILDSIKRYGGSVHHGNPISVSLGKRLSETNSNIVSKFFQDW
ncbi:uncharacterized protein [Watersipora subatra]|uniref:uncharacterized protein n=1 Tax=Watersipora subatra TaxID=2589382 RepID=UPI00355BD1D0